LTRVPKPKTAAERQARVKKILDLLDQMYPGVTCALHHSNAWELLVATILSAQCTDKRVNMVTPGLFKKYPTIQDFAAAKQEFHTTSEQLDKSRTFAERQLRYNILSAAYGYRVATQVFNDGDPQVERAVAAMPKARELAQAATRARARG